MAVLSDYVAAQIALRDGRRDPAVERCVERIQASDGPVALAELGALAGLGERQLQRRFAEVVGISPRTLAVVVRLRRVFDALRDAPLSTWSERAQAAGFFDHPQMARDFRRLLGTAPSRWAAADRVSPPASSTAPAERCRKPTSAARRGALYPRRSSAGDLMRLLVMMVAAMPVTSAAPRAAARAVVAERRLAPLQGWRDRRGALARPARRDDGRREPDVGERQGEVREPAHRRAATTAWTYWGVADAAARRCRSG